MCNRTKLDLIDIRLGHIKYRDLVHLVNNEKVRCIPILNGEPKPICGECTKSKQTKSSQKKVEKIRSTRPLDLIPMYLMGPMHTESRCGKNMSQVLWIIFKILLYEFC